MLTIVLEGYVRLSVGRAVKPQLAQSSCRRPMPQSKAKLVLVMELGGGDGAHVGTTKVENCAGSDVLPPHRKQSHAQPEPHSCWNCRSSCSGKDLFFSVVSPSPPPRSFPWSENDKADWVSGT